MNGPPPVDPNVWPDPEPELGDDPGSEGASGHGSDADAGAERDPGGARVADFGPRTCLIPETPIPLEESGPPLLPSGRHKRDIGRGSARVRHLPVPLRGGRWAVDQSAAVTLGLVVLAAVMIAAGHAWRARSTVQSLPAPAVSAVARATPSQPGIVVDVQGRVRHPGVVQLPAGSRVTHALRAAGGVVSGADTSALNLARVLTDGEQLFVGAPPPSTAASPGRPAATAGPGPTADSLLDLNTATGEQLQELPGVGPVLAQRIVDWRAEHSRFQSVEELQEVSGIGERRFADLRKRVRV